MSDFFVFSLLYDHNTGAAAVKLGLESTTNVAGGGYIKPFHVKIDTQDVNDSEGGVVNEYHLHQHHQSEMISMRNTKEKNCESLSDNSSEGNRHDGIFKNGVPDLGEWI